MTNRCSGLLALSLCGTSVAYGKETEHLGRQAKSISSHEHVRAKSAGGFMFLTSLTPYHSPPRRQRESGMNGCPLWSSLDLPVHKSNLWLSGKHLGALKILETGKLLVGHLYKIGMTATDWVHAVITCGSPCGTFRWCLSGTQHCWWRAGELAS
jgi:hypothetical protein